MIARSLSLAALALALPAVAAADETRGLDAHVHGEGALNIAVEGKIVMIELEVPGADIVGFEHAAKSDEDRAAIEEGKAKLSDPLALFVLPEAAGCAVELAEVRLVTEEDAHGHGDHGHGEEHGHDDHGHGEEHAEGEHGEHAHSDEHAEAEHSEFRAEYRLGCADPAAITAIEFAYFETFPNAEELDIQMITGKGSTGFEVTRAAPRLDLGGAI